MRAQAIVRLVLVSGVLFLPRAAWTQTASSGSIAGVVRDTTGAVLPGVTVEAASPALIEKVRIVVTDEQGQYKIVELRPGIYTVTFTLPGFSTFKREGIELTTGFTATANAELRVGALEETVTVTGASPIVDVQNVRAQTLLSREVLDTLPTGQTISGFAALTVGATLQGVGGSMHDVGGNKGEQFGTILIHGSRSSDGRLLYDGMRFNNMHGSGGGSARFWVVNQAAVTEVAIETSGMSAEAETGGVHQNSVPKDGGNTFQVYVNTSGTNGDLQASNLTDRLRARGVTKETQVKKIYDFGVGVGGPIKRDKLWFYSAHRRWGTQEYAAGNFFNKTQSTPFYTPDLSRQGYTHYPQKDYSLRLTWQAAPKHKITFSDSNQKNCQCYNQVDVGIYAPEATIDYHFAPTYLAISTWSYPATNRLLFEAGAAYLHNRLSGRLVKGVTTNDIAITELSKNYTYNSSPQGLPGHALVESKGTDISQHNERFTVSYITGSHAFKVGVFTLWGRHIVEKGVINQALHYRFNFGLPAQLVQWASPLHSQVRTEDVGMYAQDQWTVRNLTLNLGMRFDYVNGHVPDHLRPAGRFVPALHIDRIDNVPNYADVSPRLGAAYDLFGNGKTALKVSLGRYVGQVGANITFAVNPANALAVSSTRTWTDTNGNFQPDCNLHSLDANGECGALDNKKFGGTASVATRYAPDVLDGFGIREYNWQSSVSVQHELRPGMAVTVGYFRTWFGNFRATDNVLVTPADYDPFCVAAPVDARLPGGGGYQICEGLGDIKPGKFGLVDNLVTRASHFGKQREVYDGIDATFNARFGRGGLLQGGMNVGRTQTQCVVVDAPVQFCKNVPPFFQPQIKLAGVYPLPFWDLQASATFQNLPGIPIGSASSGNNAATYVATNAEIKPSLGRDLAAGARGVATVTLFEQNTRFEDRLTQLDIRFTKNVRMGRARVRGMFDVYNIFNADTILANGTRYGRSFLVPSAVMGARMFKFGAQLDF